MHKPLACGQPVDNIVRYVGKTSGLNRRVTTFCLACGKIKEFVHQMYSAFARVLHIVRRQITSVIYRFCALSTLLNTTTKKYIEEFI